MRTRTWIFTFCVIAAITVTASATPAGLAQGTTQNSGQNPTPIVITLTPATPTPDSGLAPDRFEPNDDMTAATSIGFGVETGLTLSGGDVDAFTGFLKAGQLLQVATTVHGGLDTRLRLYWNGQPVAENDDRSPVELGSLVTFAAPANGRFVAIVDRVGEAEGVYDLEISLVEPTATPTPAPTLTPSPTPTVTPSPTPLLQPDAAEPNDQAARARPVTPGSRGRYTIGPGDEDFFSFIAKAGTGYSCETVTDQVDTLLIVHAGDSVVGSNDDRAVGRVDSYFAWKATEEQTVVVQLAARGGSYGAYELVCAARPEAVTAKSPPAAPVGPPRPAATPTATPTITTTETLTATTPLTLAVRHLGRVEPEGETTTAIRLLVYYDANNDRAPGPGEGIPNVSVLAVDALGQRLAQVFTNTRGEATFQLAEAGVDRIIVPFVPAWSARVRAGEVNDGIVLGLPAVRLPVFFPVAAPAAQSD